MCSWILPGNTGEHECNGDTNCKFCWIGLNTGGLGNERTSGDDLNHSIIEIGQNTEKSPETRGYLLSLKLHRETNI